MLSLSWATWSSHTLISPSAHTEAATAQGVGRSWHAGLAAWMLLLSPSNTHSANDLLRDPSSSHVLVQSKCFIFPGLGASLKSPVGGKVPEAAQCPQAL